MLLHSQHRLTVGVLVSAPQSLAATDCAAYIYSAVFDCYRHVYATAAPAYNRPTAVTQYVHSP